MITPPAKRDSAPQCCTTTISAAPSSLPSPLPPPDGATRQPSIFPLFHNLVLSTLLPRNQHPPRLRLPAPHARPSQPTRRAARKFPPPYTPTPSLILHLLTVTPDVLHPSPLTVLLPHNPPTVLIPNADPFPFNAMPRLPRPHAPAPAAERHARALPES